MIEFKQENLYIAMWFVDQPSMEYRRRTGVPNMNWIACVWKRPDGCLEVRFRFAYWDNLEILIDKNWYRAEMSAPFSVETVICGIDETAKLISVRNGGSFWERVDLGVYGSEAIKKIQSRDWANIRMIPTG
jgi:hypothetical protein